MIRATAIVRRPAVKAERVTDTVILDHQARHRRRIVMTGEKGTQFLLDLDKASVLDHGDALKLEDGRLVQVEAAPESLIEVRTSSPLRLLKAAWHLGNRHVPAEITEEAIYFAEDHVLLEMVRGLGAIATPVVRPFRPEKGAYEAAEAHGHGGHDHHGHDHHGHDHHGHDHHGHDHHGHDHHDHDHHDHAHHGHEHGAACGCGHDHSHDHAHSHDHDHSHAHSHAEAHSHAGAGGHAEAHSHAEAHAHGEECGCGHHHKHG